MQSQQNEVKNNDNIFTKVLIIDRMALSLKATVNRKVLDISINKVNCITS